MGVVWLYNDGSRFADTLFIVEDNGRQRKIVEDNGRELPTHYVVWQTVVDSGNGRQRKTVENTGRLYRTVRDSDSGVTEFCDYCGR